MKRIKYIFSVILAVILTNLTTIVTAQDFPDGNVLDKSAQNNRADEEATAWLDSVDISLLTCGPGEEVWSYYGHSALRIEDRAHGTDVAVNWGMFSFRQDYFVLRFVFGLTDYQIGIYPMTDFLAEYSSESRWVRQQHIRLSRSEKLEILKAIEENAKPENRTYRYNFFYDNCTTRARDMILSHLGKNATNFKNGDSNSTYRKEIHRWNENHRWARFGNDLLLGYPADLSIDKKEWEFLPENLMKDFDAEMRKDGKKLVDDSSYLITPQTEVAEVEPIVPKAVFLGILVVVLGLTIAEGISKKNFWWLDTILMTATGLPGLILLAMVFSQHPTVQVNFQLLILNPLNLLFVWQVTRKARKGEEHWYAHVWWILAGLAIVLHFKQDYAEGMNILALSLLLRSNKQDFKQLILKRKKKN